MASIRRAARDVLAALLLRVDRVCAADRAQSPERVDRPRPRSWDNERPHLADIFKTSPELRRERDALYSSPAVSDRSSPARRSPRDRRSPRRRRRSLSSGSEAAPPVPAVEAPPEGCTCM